MGGEKNGQGGIRTLDTLLAYTRSPGVRLQPLGHLSRLVASAQLSEPAAAGQRDVAVNVRSWLGWMLDLRQLRDMYM